MNNSTINQPSPEIHEQPVSALDWHVATLQTVVIKLKNIPRERSSREVSLAITKLEEAIMWLDKA